uniref:Uncharacterized protein n=1 Tax=Cacopsylla melanoneura TaxID=428564 RepID=A0A8D8S1V9_9HEMI
MDFYEFSRILCCYELGSTQYSIDNHALIIDEPNFPIPPGPQKSNFTSYRVHFQSLNNNCSLKPMKLSIIDLIRTTSEVTFCRLMVGFTKRLLKVNRRVNWEISFEPIRSPTFSSLIGQRDFCLLTLLLTLKSIIIIIIIIIIATYLYY